MELRSKRLLGLSLEGMEFGDSVVVADGRTKFTIENSTRTQLVVAGENTRILGGCKGIRMA
jgi:hypothetical protein